MAFVNVSIFNPFQFFLLCLFMLISSGSAGFQKQTPPPCLMSLSSTSGEFIAILILCLSLFFPPVFDQLDLVTYEEVVKLPAFQRKTLVLLGEK